MNTGGNKEEATVYTSNSIGNKFSISLRDINMIDDEYPDIYKP